MANTRTGNTWYVDTQYSAATDDLAGNLVVLGVVVTATAANGRIVLADASNQQPTRLDLRVATSGESKFFSFRDCNVSFQSGIRAATLSNAVATVILKGSGA